MSLRRWHARTSSSRQRPARSARRRLGSRLQGEACASQRCRRSRKRSSPARLPAGEGYIAPLETIGDGTIVFDGSLAGYGLLASPVRITVKGGRAVDAENGAGNWLLETLDAGGEYGRSLAELGIGTNPAAILTGNVLEDEKVIGTAHLAFGTSAGIGGVNAAGVHIDGILLRPTVELDGERVLDDGHLVVAQT